MTPMTSSRADAPCGAAHHTVGLMTQTLALAEVRGTCPLLAHCHFGLGKLYRRTGPRAKAEEHLATATTMYREMGMGFWLEKAEAAWGALR
jgi:hypothetical protein